MVLFETLTKIVQDKFTHNGKIPVAKSYYNPEQYKNLVIPNWDLIINEYINRFTKEKIINNLHGKENYPKGALQYKEGGSAYYHCQILDEYNVIGKKVAIIGSENPWIESIVYNYGCRDITTVEYNKPNIEHENFKIISYEDFVNSDTKYDFIISYSSIEHSGLGRYGDDINPDGDIETMNQIYNKLNDNGYIFLGIPIGPDTLVWNANRIYGKYRLPILLKKLKIIKWIGGDKSCFDIKPKYSGYWVPQPILICKKNI